MTAYNVTYCLVVPCIKLYCVNRFCLNTGASGNKTALDVTQGLSEMPAGVTAAGALKSPGLSPGTAGAAVMCQGEEQEWPQRSPTGSESTQESSYLPRQVFRSFPPQCPQWDTWESVHFKIRLTFVPCYTSGDALTKTEHLILRSHASYLM